MSLFGDPLGWSEKSIGSGARLAITAAANLVALAAVVYSVASWGWRSALGTVFLVGMFQWMQLYAHWRLYRKLTDRDAAAADERVRQRHFFASIGLVAAGVLAVVLESRFWQVRPSQADGSPGRQADPSHLPPGHGDERGAAREPRPHRIGNI
jgi:hypothetical protein